MRLAAFIRADAPQIAREWEAFAQTLIPASEGMSPLALRNHIKAILEFIATDIESAQTEKEQIKKSRGQKHQTSKHSAAVIHASLREAGGFDIDQMVSEFRALRASVTRRWGAQLMNSNSQDLADIIRFNEAMDQALAESVEYYSKKAATFKNMFLEVVSRDLRNPLNAVRMAADLMLKSGTPNERQTMLLFQIIDSANRANETASHLVDLTRARLGSGLPVIKEPMNMGLVGKKLIDEMRSMHPDRTFTFQVSGDAEGKWDKARIGQVFSNLLSNAVRYSFAESSINITINGSPEDVSFSVHSEGTPIAPKVLERIFDALTRGVEERANNNHPRAPNLGLGLYITKEIVAAHGGTVSVISTEKDGTTFTARFPRVPV